MATGRSVPLLRMPVSHMSPLLETKAENTDTRLSKVGARATSVVEKGRVGRRGERGSLRVLCYDLMVVMVAYCQRCSSGLQGPCFEHSCGKLPILSTRAQARLGTRWPCGKSIGNTTIFYATFGAYLPSCVSLSSHFRLLIDTSFLFLGTFTGEWLVEPSFVSAWCKPRCKRKGRREGN